MSKLGTLLGTLAVKLEVFSLYEYVAFFVIMLALFIASFNVNIAGSGVATVSAFFMLFAMIMMLYWSLIAVPSLTSYYNHTDRSFTKLNVALLVLKVAQYFAMAYIILASLVPVWGLPAYMMAVFLLAKPMVVMGLLDDVDEYTKAHWTGELTEAEKVYVAMGLKDFAEWVGEKSGMDEFLLMIKCRDPAFKLANLKECSKLESRSK